MGILDGLRWRYRQRWHLRTPSYGVQVANLDTAALYRTQPNLRAAVGFLADNAAQVPLKVFERRGDDDRPRVLDSPAALLLQRPNPDMTAFELKRAIYSDLYLYGSCLVLLLPDADAPSGWQLRHIPATWVDDYTGTDPFAPDGVRVSNPYGEKIVEFPRDRFLLFHGYDPSDPIDGGNPVEALKDVLHEQVESNAFRRQMWQRGGRFNAYIKRPKDVEKWDDASFERFRDTFRASWAGSGASEGGGMPILEDGMEIAQVQFNSRDAQWAEAKKLGREDVAGLYHFNPALLWPGSGQTYASAKDNARALYNEALAPKLMEVTNRLDMDLLPRIGEPSNHYVAYDITIKTEGSFEEKVQALQTATGAPILTRNEARAKLDLPAIEGGDELVVPLNVLTGGLASPYDADPSTERYNAGGHAAKCGCMAAKEMDEAPRLRYKAAPQEGEADEMAAVYRRFFKRQRNSVLPRIGAGGEWWDAERWDAELADDLAPVAIAQATASARRALRELELDGEDYSEPRTEAYLRAMCESRAKWCNRHTKELLDQVEGWEGGEDAERATYEGVFDEAEDSRAGKSGAAIAAAVVGFGALEAVRQCAQGRGVTKTWNVNSANPRASHQALDGETVGYEEEFSNGAQWPGDGALDAADVANCQCTITLTVG